jgi:transposase, IS5 family
MHQWVNLSDLAMKAARHDSESTRRCAGMDLTTDLVLDETTILRFRHRLERHQLAEKLFAAVRQLLENKQPLLKFSAVVDATIIATLPATKNAAQERDRKMKQTRTGGKPRHFGMKVHVCTGRRSFVQRLATGSGL